MKRIATYGILSAPLTIYIPDNRPYFNMSDMAIATLVGLGTRHVSIIYGRVRFHIGNGFAVCKFDQDLVLICAVYFCPVNLQIRRGTGRPAVGIVGAGDFRDADSVIGGGWNRNRVFLKILVPAAVGQLHLGDFDCGNLDAWNLDGWRDGVRGYCNCCNDK